MNAIQATIDRIGTDRRFDRIASAMEATASRLDEKAGGLLRGDWLGHPLHPSLTDLPIGFWTSSFVLDFVGGARSRPAAQRLLAIGVLSVIPTAAAGLVDWKHTDGDGARGVGVVHAVSNTTATLLYALSWQQRRRGRHLAGVALGVAGAGAATIGGYLGGRLAFGSIDENEIVDSSAPPQEDRALDGKIGA